MTLASRRSTSGGRRRSTRTGRASCRTRNLYHRPLARARCRLRYCRTRNLPRFLETKTKPKGAQTPMSRNNGNYHEKRIANLTSPEAIELAMSLVANLIGPENNLPLMGEARLTPKTFPKTDNPDLEFARTVLRMIYTAVEEGLPPTKENIMPRLLLELGREEAER